MTDYVLGIDPGTRLGWAVLGKNGLREASGVIDLSTSRWQGGGMRYVKARRAFLDLIEAWKPKLVVFEEVRRHRGVDAAHVYGGLIAHLTSVCEDSGVPYCGVKVGDVKKAATGKGGGPGTGKEEMVSAASDEWGFIPKTDDEADACWIAKCGVGMLA